MQAVKSIARDITGIVVGAIETRRPLRFQADGYPLNSPHRNGLCFRGRFLFTRVDDLDSLTLL